MSERQRYTEDFIDRVGLFYEVNEKSAKEVAVFFSLKEKTVESWISRKGWIKGRLKGQANELKSMMDKDKYSAVVGQMASDGVIAAAADMTDGDLKKANIMIQHLAIEQIGSSTIDNEMKWALQKAKPFAENAKNIGVLKTYTDIAKSVKEGIYGKSPDVSFELNFGNIKQEELASMTIEQKRKLLQQAEQQLLTLEANQDGNTQ